MNKIICKFSRFLSIAMFFMIILSLIPRLSGSIPSNYFDNNTQENINTIYPQGWSFFTKDVREEIPYIYKIDEDRLIKLFPDAFTFENSFGVSRLHRTGNLDLAILMKKIDEAKIQGEPCTINHIVACSSNIPESNILKLSIQHDSNLCGYIIIERRTPLPYAYREFKDDILRTKIWKLEVRC
ncbi:MAG: SdpA family antimicrobial peptide system protein [Rothia sp. (in: high G+C Gram-positive bacteria)]|uniref:SdpA family antimicrobial peptide system protein n=1 Tax=Rothia sp. (in: high G+C Gram-positive bacteria) TaxID=1885016 RepID=UPI0026DF811D|nr:SdpA family antimicrobial peptide system protein [Rothia sp. (in: high G+C Gram-positive bacteria)]MDO5750508.1 SdpA family antimicrobial peptide system protein [Rothia sp. (in: high G+C Gram-positive bacteria)]